MKIDEWLRDLKMGKKAYFRLVLISVVVFGLVIPMVMSFFLAPIVGYPLAYILYVLPAFGIVVVLLLPAVYSGKRKMNVENNMPMFVTTMAALSTSDMSFDKVFYILSEKKEFGQLAEDAKQIYRLLKHYSVGAAEACRFVAQRTSSQTESDFFQRLSHSLDVGEKLDRFMHNEHDVMMDEYMLKSESALKDLDFVKEIYTGITTSLIFTAVFVAITPILGGKDIDLLLFGVVASFVSMEGFFIYFLKTKVPKDNIWYSWRAKIKRGYVTDGDRIIFTSVLVSIFGIILLAFVMIPSGFPIQFIASTIFLPVLFPGILIYREERRIEKRDNLYGAFIRSLGRSSEVSGTTMSDGVKKLAMHKFGPLTDMIKNLSKRLAMHINATDSWRHFSAECSSSLIDKFGEMYVLCIQNGSKPEPTSIFISSNMFKVLTVRKRRQTIASSFVGILYGIMISLSVTLYVTIGIVAFMGKMMSDLAVQNPDFISGGFLTSIFSASYSTAGIELMAFSVIFIHALMSSLMLPMLKGGHLAGAVIHFIALMWIGSVGSYFSSIMIGGLIGTGS
jgi:flagellar protein FlaJ